MKVIFITTESTLDHSFTMINELRNHIDIKPYIIAKELTSELNEYCTRLNAEFVKRHSFKNLFSIFKEYGFISRLKKEKADLYWFNRASLYQTLFIKMLIKYHLINIHDVNLHPEEKDYHGIMSQKMIFRLLKNIAVMSRTQSDIFEKRFKRKPFLLQLPIIDYYKSISPPAVVAKGAKVKFFFFGSVMPYKGIEKLIEASALLEKKTQDFEVNIFGKLNYNKDGLTQKINSVKSITLHNRFIDYKEVSGVFASNDVLIIPYIQVSQCGPLLIAYSQNVPVITSDLPGFAEYVDDGKSGLLFDGTAESLAEKMEMLINNRKTISDMSSYIQTDMHKKFSMASLAKDYVSVFSKTA